jgi:peptide deformylase
MQINDSVLKDNLRKVPEGTDVTQLVSDMFDFMYKNKGIGLAANQVGNSSRVFVMDAGCFKQEFINPVITKRYGGSVRSEEGCLSFPNRKKTMFRNRQIIIEGFDKDWNPVKRKLKGIASICAQHELDHLNGKTIL